MHSGMAFLKHVLPFEMWSKSFWVASCALPAFLVLASITITEGQSMENIYEMALYGANVVGSPGDPDGGGVARLDLNFNFDSIIYEIALWNVSEPHTIALLMGSDTTSTAGACMRADLLSRTTSVTSSTYGTYTIRGATPVMESTLRAIVATPANFFILITTRQYPNGAVRAQLVDSNSGVSYSSTTGGTSMSHPGQT